jgi:hypothetical protein
LNISIVAAGGAFLGPGLAPLASFVEGALSGSANLLLLAVVLRFVAGFTSGRADSSTFSAFGFLGIFASEAEGHNPTTRC